MGRPTPRRSPPSGSVLLWDRRHREATQALAARAAEALSHNQNDDPSPTTGEGQRAGAGRFGSVGGRA